MKFGVRECADVVLRAKENQKIGNKIFYKHEPVCYFDTLKTSTFEGAATTVYAQGGRGNARLMSWDGERTITFTMEDALISQTGLSILTGAGLMDATASTPVIQHITEQTTDYDVSGGANSHITTIRVKKKPYIPEGDATGHYIYVMELNDHGEVISEPYIYDFDQEITDDDGQIVYQIKLFEGTYNGGNPDLPGDKTRAVLVDYYTAHESGAMEINITPDKFGGTYYLEASTLWRDQGTGKDYPAEFIIPSCRVQSNFSFTMAASGDPSSFTFTLDAFPDYTRWDPTRKVLASIQVIGVTDTGDDNLIREATWTNRIEDSNGIIRKPSTET